jgi:phage terminase Nu1 subunit (DNA packaging protein)
MTTYPVDTLCKLLDLTPRRVQQLTSEGVLVKVERGRYDLVKSVRGYIAYLRDRALKADAAETEDTSRNRKTAAEAEIAEIHRDTLKADRLKRFDVADAWKRIASEVRTKSLGFPTRVTPQLMAFMKTKVRPAQIEEVLRNEMEALLRVLSSTTVTSEPEPKHSE